MLGGLWRQANFLKLWLGETVSQLGSTVTRDALPLTAVIAIGASPLQLGLLGAAGTAPALLFGLIAGAWADRRRRRPILITADLGRAALVGTIPLAAAFGRLRVEHLYVVAVLAGVLTVFFDVAYRSYLPSLVRSEQLVEANGMLAASESIAEFSGAPLAGVLVQALSGPTALLLDAVSFVWSAGCIGLIRTPERMLRTGDGAQSLATEIRAGLRTVWRSPLLRAPAAALAVMTLFGNIIGTTYYLYTVRTLGLQPAAIGLIIACGGLGALPGSLVAAPVARRFGAGRTLVATAAAGAIIALMIPLARGPALAAATVLALNQFGGDLLRAIYMTNEISLRQAVAPPEQLGRVSGTVHVLAQGATPIGLLAGGLLAEALGIRPALVIAAAGQFLAALLLLASPLRYVREVGRVAVSDGVTPPTA